MCNLYSITRTQEAMRRLFSIDRDLTGNLPPLPSVFPDQLAPVVRTEEGGRQLELMRWGMPGPPRSGGAPVTNIRNVRSPHWRAWLAPNAYAVAAEMLVGLFAENFTDFSGKVPDEVRHAAGGRVTTTAP